MAIDFWGAAAPLIGVVLGGLVTFGGQEYFRRSADREERRRRDADLAEARRAERLTYILEFLTTVQAAERIAADRIRHPAEDLGQWQAQAEEMIDRLWVLQKTIHILCAEPLNHAARQVAFAMQKVLREGPTESTGTFTDRVAATIRPSRNAFLAIAHSDVHQHPTPTLTRLKSSLARARPTIITAHSAEATPQPASIGSPQTAGEAA